MSERPTQPPSTEEKEAIAAFEASLKKLEKRSNSGMIRVLAEAWAYLKDKES
jgi:hypothetical protein